MPRLRQNEIERAIGMLAAGMTQVQVANRFNVSKMTIVLLKTRLRATCTTHDRPRSGRPRETTDGRARVYRRRNEGLFDACVQETDRFGDGGIMVWVGITYQERIDAQLRTALLKEWNNIPQDFIRRLVDSMRRRCPAVINASGGIDMLT
ncbi:Hypothetical predicted protein [Mytilus galloprovincialis]|uniref:Resolvase HTH domain-containing protein n=1 Tax=Mytilus galloprovincialis TaxID=29158 RepID=A0A8B6FWJ2_MYTGA|nr:Hypothetical predicted protein [Mytilus galloprovincialis]